MLCALIEDKVETSHRYWPDALKEPMEYGRLFVTLTSEDMIDQAFIRRVFTITGDKVHLCTHCIVSINILI